MTNTGDGERQLRAELAKNERIVAHNLPPADAGTNIQTYLCAACPMYDLNLCPANRKELYEFSGQNSERIIDTSSHTIPARRIIHHFRDWSDTVSVICRGWAFASVDLPRGRRQILKFLLPGDFFSLAALAEANQNQFVEAITPVTYRDYKLGDVKMA